MRTTRSAAILLRVVVVRVLLIATLVAVAGCGSQTFVDATNTTTNADAGGALDDGAARPPDAAAADSAATGTCPSGMVRTPKTCIDAREVSVAQYAAFVAEAARAPFDFAKLPVGCERKRLASDFASGMTNAQPDLPIANVDWCDAQAFCIAAGKRLCGKVGGGPVANTLEDSEWLDACTKGGTQQVPYTPQPAGQNEVGRCVIHEDATRGTTRAGNLCEGGYPGLFDMLGNVEEWIDACSGTGIDAPCVALGSAFNDELELLDSRCDSRFEVSRMTRRADVGFRCCR